MADWKDDHSYAVQQAMKQAGWALHLFDVTASGLVATLTDDQLDELERYLGEMSTTNCDWAEYKAKSTMYLAVDGERRTRRKAAEERDQGQPVVFNHWATPTHI